MVKIESVIDYAIYNYIHTQEFWNQYIVFGNNVFHFEMDFENLFLYSDYAIKGINIEFVLKYKDSLSKREITYSVEEFDDLVLINYVDLYVDLMFLSMNHYCDESYKIRNIYVKEEKLYINSNTQPELYFYFDLSKYSFSIDISNYAFGANDYLVSCIDDLNILNIIGNKENISIKYKPIDGSNIDFIQIVYQLEKYKHININLSNCELDLCKSMFSSLTKSKPNITHKSIYFSRDIFYNDNKNICINMKCKELIEQSLKYFSDILLI